MLFLVARRVPPVPSPVLVEVARRLRARGHVVDTVIVEEAVSVPERLSLGHDLYVIKSHTELTLSLAGVLHAQGARTLNPYPACVMVQDKLTAAARLAAAGVPVPRSWTTGDLRMLAPVIDSWPVVVKPHRGHRGAGVAVVPDPATLAALPAPAGPVLVQEHVPGRNEDLKVYVVGEDVFAVRKPFSADSFTRPGRPVPVTPEVRELALRAGAAFGLGLYGLDVIESPAGPVVVDLNYFPGYKGVPDVAPLIADYIHRFAGDLPPRRRPSAIPRGGRYVLRAETGRDRTGVLWQGTDKLLGREVVVKEVTVAEHLPAKERGARQQRLLREARKAGARLGHPSAVTPCDAFQDQGRTFIVSEPVDAPTLAELVEHRPCAPAEAAAIGRQLLDVLKVAHGKGVVHGDVRPENVRVLSDGRVKLTNFGGSGSPEDDLWSLGRTLSWSVGERPAFDDAALRGQLDGLADGHRRAGETANGHRRAGETATDPPAVALEWLAATRPTRPVAGSANTRALLALVAEGFASRLAFGLIGFALPLYARSLGLSLAAIGVLASLNTVIALALKPIMGAVADRYGRKRTLGVAMAVRSVLALLYGLATTPLALYGVRVGHGLADSMRDPSVAALIADNGGKKAVASAFAWYQTAKTVAGSVGKSAAGVLLAASAGSYAPVFAAAFALSALPLLVVAVFVRDGDSPAAREADLEPPAPPAQGRPAGPRTRPYVVLGFLVSGAAGMLGTLFPILAIEYAGLSPAQAGALYLVTPALALSGPVFGWLADHVSSRLVLSLRSVANVGSSLLYLLVPAAPGFLAGKALDDLGKAAFKPAWGAVMAEVSSFDRSRRARTMSWMSAGEDAGDIAAPVVAGLLWTVWGAPAVLLARAGLALAAEGWALWLTRSDARRPGARASPRCST
jgi:glutathione synthase/RimK-type ligase-like ATP-grasp enzyme/MFS family permease